MGNVLVTGGLGYIGAHCCVALIEAGYRPVIFDNLANSHLSVLDRIAHITGHRPRFVQGDVRDANALRRAFASRRVGAVLHFAGLKSVGESTRRPIEYFDVNVHGTLNLLAVMKQVGVETIVFSSSATVYGDPDVVPVPESAARRPTNPYGQSKLMAEDVLEALAAAEPSWRIARLRYFNPVGAHLSGLLGEDPHGTPNNLMPFIAQVAVGRRDHLVVFGDDYPTPDGTGVRDYIHVVDLATGHLAALRHLERARGIVTFNLGTGRGHSVKEVIAAFAEASGREIPFVVSGRRPGDVAVNVADPGLATRLLGWSASRTLRDMCADTWRWQSRNPDGYEKPDGDGATGMDRPTRDAAVGPVAASA